VRVTVQGSRGQDEDEAPSLLIRPICAPYGLHVASARAQGRMHFAHVLFFFLESLFPTSVITDILETFTHRGSTLKSCYASFLSLSKINARQLL